ncbi:MAG: DUF3253 domain-containing protein [Rhodospirillales bacterium]
MSEETPDGTPKGDLEARLSDHILRLVGNLDPGKTICPSDVARAEREEDWRPLMKPVRRCAQRLAREGRIAIYRKGKPVDPETFKGVIRLGLP